ncbi:hypothetical protein EV426DRAFT_601650 [Tirmania nivea]|nr:hypothetical protein EV426DRAFT_601650 [Tirmania nivea]
MGQSGRLTAMFIFAMWTPTPGRGLTPMTSAQSRILRYGFGIRGGGACGLEEDSSKALTRSKVSLAARNRGLGSLIVAKVVTGGSRLSSMESGGAAGGGIAGRLTGSGGTADGG